MFPEGCGKGHDTAVLGAWLNDAIMSFDSASLDAACLRSLDKTSIPDPIVYICKGLRLRA